MTCPRSARWSRKYDDHKRPFGVPVYKRRSRTAVGRHIAPVCRRLFFGYVQKSKYFFKLVDAAFTIRLLILKSSASFWRNLSRTPLARLGVAAGSLGMLSNSAFSLSIFGRIRG